MDICFELAIEKTAEKILRFWLNLPENTKKQGHKGFFLIATLPATVVISKSFGEFEDKNHEERVLTEALEKVNRQRQEKQKGHISGRQSADPESGRFGGSVTTDKEEYVFAVAGLGQLGDEAVGLAITLELDLISKKRVDEIVGISKNILFISLMEAVQAGQSSQEEQA